MVVSGDRIRSVGTEVPAHVEVMDLSRYTGIPGLIDVHTHMTYFWDQTPGINPFQQHAARMPSVNVYLAQENARRTLEAGVTTVRDLGALDYDDIAMRDLINQGAMVGPRMFVAGYAIQVSTRPARPGFVEPSGGVADGVPEVLRVVRQQIAAGADWIKMIGSTREEYPVGSMMGYQTYTFDEMKAAVEVAHQYGKRIAIHSYGPSGARDAVRAGADSIEHAMDMDDATLADMVRRGTFFVPTIDTIRYYLELRNQTPL